MTLVRTVTARTWPAATTLAGAPVAIVCGGRCGIRAEAAAAVRDALLAAGAAVTTVAVGGIDSTDTTGPTDPMAGPGAPVPPGTQWVVDLAGMPAAGDRGGGAPGSGLGPDSVVVVAGGGRGIEDRAATALVRAFGCVVDLVGPDDEASHLAGRGDEAVAARRAILGRGELGRPGEIAVERERTLAAREVRRTRLSLCEHAAFAGHRSLDPRDAAALAAAIDEVRTRRGRLDGVVRVAEVARDAGDRGGPVGDAAPGEVA